MPTTVVLVALALATSLGAQETGPYKGLPLADALRALQQRGLRVVFSSAVVTPEMLVVSEPRATEVRQQLDELLGPHGLEIRNGPGGTLQVVRGRRQTPEAPRHATSASNADRGDKAATPPVADDPLGAARHVEYVAVTDSPPRRIDRGVASEMRLEQRDLEQLRGSLADDPVRAAHAFPHVAIVDDLRSDFVMRASPVRHGGLVIDGVSTQWLQHSAPGRPTTGSLSMLSSLLVDSMTLRAGAYPRRHSERLGPELELALREGSRTEVRLRGAVGGTHGMLIGEGPIGRDDSGASARGSWLVAARQSYLEWPGQSNPSTAGFGFADALGKAVFDLNSTQRISFTALTGVASIDTEDDDEADEWESGANRASAFNLSLQSSFAPTFAVSQRVYVVTQHVRHVAFAERAAGESVNHAVGYRVDVSRPLAGGLLEAGARVEQQRVSQPSALPTAAGFVASSWTRSGFAHFALALSPTFTLSPGLRVTSSTLLRTPAVSRWLLAEWSFRPGWSVIASTGALRQLPELVRGLSDAQWNGLRPERARHAEIGLERQLRNGIRWQVNGFVRREADILGPCDAEPRLMNGEFLLAANTGHENALQGTAHGVELMIERRRPLGLTGWAAYSFGRARHTDTERGETYWADFDQRHTLNLSATYRFSPQTSANATFHASSNLPVPGYFDDRNGRLFLSDARNQVRLPPYARLDLRADHAFHYLGRRFTLFVETLNVLNRTNVGRAIGSVDPVTGEAIGFTHRLLRRRASAGVIIEF
jgi:hypothetical protein